MVSRGAVLGTVLLVLAATAGVAHGNNNIRVGSGISDITGPSVDIGFMGYAMLEQVGTGIHTRLKARAFVFEDRNTGKVAAFVSADVCMVFNEVRTQVIKLLEADFPGVFSLDNVMISATHTHAGPGAFAYHTLYDVTTLGWQKSNFDALTVGMYEAIAEAYREASAQPEDADGRMTVITGRLNDTNINRSPTSYTANPPAEQAKWAFMGDTDKQSVLLKIMQISNRTGTKVVGMVNWFAVHGTSLHNTNTLVSGDNKGYASERMEDLLNGYYNVKSGDFVAAFAQSNEGDVSPNTRGPLCPDMKTPCNAWRSTCDGKVENCVAQGPGKTDAESCQKIGDSQYEQALKMFTSSGAWVSPTVDFRHRVVDLETVKVRPEFSINGQAVHTCTAALGDSFAAGTVDGPGLSPFWQGANSTKDFPFWNAVGQLLSKPTPEQVACQHPKPILLNTGGIKFPAPWTVSLQPVHVMRLGQLFILGVPGEFTTMAGRRLRETVRDTILKYDPSVGEPTVVIAGLSNSYAGYITTFEEYQYQRYEAASCLYGPHELEAFQMLFSDLVVDMLTGKPAPPSPEFPDLSHTTWNLLPDPPVDTVPAGAQFGDVHTPAKSMVSPGSTQSVTFWGASMRHEHWLTPTFMLVEYLNATSGDWQMMLTDRKWTTTVEQSHPDPKGEPSQTLITCTWTVEKQAPMGTWRIRHFGRRKNQDGTFTAYEGVSKSFTVGKPFGWDGH